MGNVSVLLLIHKRPEETKRVLDAIRSYAPRKLYVVADGPRAAVRGEAALCEEARTAIDDVDWDCQVFRLFRKSNLGCRLSVSTGVDWFFDNEDSGIILEDDTLPDLSFFYFCEEILEKYGLEESVGMISGNNHTRIRPTDGESYFFSSFGGIWGWATWRRAWRNYDREMEWASSSRKSDVFARLSVNFKARKYWKWAYHQVKNQIFDTWDFQWTFTIADRRQIVVVPAENLVVNIGFGGGATHTGGGAKDVYTQVFAATRPLVHPTQIVVSRKFQLAMARLLPERRPFKLLKRKIARWIIRTTIDPLYRIIRRRRALGK